MTWEINIWVQIATKPNSQIMHKKHKGPSQGKVHLMTIWIQAFDSFS